VKVAVGEVDGGGDAELLVGDHSADHVDLCVPGPAAAEELADGVVVVGVHTQGEPCDWGLGGVGRSLGAVHEDLLVGEEGLLGLLVGGDGSAIP